jgi:hypothetical protein
MKREYFGMLFLICFVGFIFLAEYLFGQEKIENYLVSFIVIWVLIGYYVGQYSMRFPKAF